MSELSQIVEITNRRGLHARASAKFVTLASSLSSKIEVAKEGNAVAGTSIMGLMMLGAALGDSITIAAEGESAAADLAILVNLVETKFGED